MTGAIIIVGAELPQSAAHPGVLPAGDPIHPALPMGCVEVLGRSVVDRILDALHRSAFDRVVVLADNTKNWPVEINQARPSPRWVAEPWGEVAVELQNYKAAGIDSAVLISPSAYAELNVADLLQCHRDEKVSITRAFSDKRPLDVWVIDTSRLEPSDELVSRLTSDECPAYPVDGYVNFLDHPRDLRRLVADCFNNTCRLGPEGHEIRPGVWMNGAVEVHRGARIVAPAFLGRGSRIEDQCLITRCSSVEANCHVDYGTVVEDSSILPNTYVGIGLDISHSIVHGNTLLNLERDVTLRISDHGVIRPNRVLRREQYSEPPSA